MPVSPYLTARKAGVRAVPILWGLLVLTVLLATDCPEAGAAPTPAAQLVTDRPGDVQISVYLGLAGKYSQRTWVPVFLHVQGGTLPFRGHLDFRYVQGNPLRGLKAVSTLQQTIQVAPGDRYVEQLGLYISDTFYPMQVTLHDTSGKKLAEATIDLREYASGPLICALKQRSYGLEMLKTAVSTEVAEVTYINDPLYLPDNWFYLRTAEALALHDFPLIRLTARRFAALKSWLSSGGVLFVFADQEGVNLADPRLAGLLPVTLSGRTKSIPVAGQRIVIWDAALADKAQLLYSFDDEPLLVMGRYGAGCVFFCNFDPDSSSTRALPLAKLASLAREEITRIRLPSVWKIGIQEIKTHFDERVWSAIEEAPMKAPNPQTVALIFGIYTVMLVYTASFFALRDKGAMLQPGLALAAAVSFAVFYWAPNQNLDQAQTTVILTTGPANSEAGIATCYTSLLRTQHPVLLQVGTMGLDVYPLETGEERLRSQHLFQESATRWRLSISPEHNMLVRIKSTYSTKQPLQIQKEEGTAGLSVLNNGQIPLEDVIVMQREQTFYIGEIQPGAKARLTEGVNIGSYQPATFSNKLEEVLESVHSGEEPDSLLKGTFIRVAAALRPDRYSEAVYDPGSESRRAVSAVVLGRMASAQPPFWRAGIESDRNQRTIGLVAAFVVH